MVFKLVVCPAPMTCGADTTAGISTPSFEATLKVNESEFAPIFVIVMLFVALTLPFTVPRLMLTGVAVKGA